MFFLNGITIGMTFCNYCNLIIYHYTLLQDWNLHKDGQIGLSEIEASP